MRRAGLLHCADLAVPRYNVLRQRGQLPFAAGNEDSPDHQDKWQEFSLEDAFRLRVMLDLMDERSGERAASGLGPAFASNIVWGLSFAEALGARPMLWIGVIGFEGVTSSDEIETSRRHFVGSLAEIEVMVEKELELYRDGYRSHGPARIFLANATRAAEFIHERAESLGIPTAFPGSE